MKRLYTYTRRLSLTVLLLAAAACAARAQLGTTGGVIARTGTDTTKTVAQRLSFVTIGAKDLNKLKQFYIRKFGWTPISSNAGIAFFKMNGFIFALYPEAGMAAGPGIPQDGTGFKRVTFTLYYPTEKEVDRVFKSLQAKGVRLVKAPAKAPWGGYIGYVADIEDNIWEIGYNPFVDLDKDGNTIGHH